MLRRYMLETTTLFVRLVMLTAHDHSVEDLFDSINTSSLPSLHTRGSECMEWMVSGEETRVAPTPETSTGPLCNSDLSPSQNLLQSQNNCIDQSSITLFKDADGNDVGGCCYNQDYTPTYGCQDCGSCTCGVWECHQGFRNCANNNGNGNCINHETPDPHYCCNSDVGIPGGHGTCPCKRSCGWKNGKCSANGKAWNGTTSKVYTSNYVGGTLQPIESSLPRLRGLVFPPPSGVCKRSTDPPYFYANTQ